MENTTRIVCPKCGAEFEIPETTHVSVGLMIGKDSNLGIINPKVVGQCDEGKTSDRKASAPVNKAQTRINALKAAGIDTSNLFAVNSASGEMSVGRLENGAISIVDDNDPIFKNIMAAGTIPERKLFRRWVMSQMFHMLASENGFNAAMQQKGYEYSWRMLLEELRVQIALERNDSENFKQRNRWFNAEVASAMAADYIGKLKRHLDSLKDRHCKGIPYKHIHGRDYFVSDLQKKLYEPLEKAANGIAGATSAADLLIKVNHFNRRRFKLDRDAKLCSAFVAAYKGSGAYFTLRNLILFHGCGLKKDGVMQSQASSLAELEAQAETCRREGWKIFAMMNKAITDNGIDIKAKMADWSAR